MCDLPVDYIRNIIRQLVESHCVTLQNCNFLSFDLSEVEDDLDDMLEHVVSHHERAPREQFLIVHYNKDAHPILRKLRLSMIGNNLSEDFEEMWTEICEGVPSIECSIG